MPAGSLLTAVSVCWLAASSLSIYPHSLSYFNESVGGPLNGPHHLLGSNVDWGQDLLYLEEWRGSQAMRGVILLDGEYMYEPNDAGIKAIVVKIRDARALQSAGDVTWLARSVNRFGVAENSFGLRAGSELPRPLHRGAGVVWIGYSLRVRPL